MPSEKSLQYEKKILHLTLKRKWFDLIVSGTKKIEIRQTKPYWVSRIQDDRGEYIAFDEIHFRNGYGSDKPFMVVEHRKTSHDIVIFKDECICGQNIKGKEHMHSCFLIHLGTILRIENYVIRKD
jgi:hypothetical protein